LVIFELCREWFAFPGEAIREILRPTTVYFVPGCPASLEGVINVRGDIESVVRLAELLGKPASDRTSMSSILRGQGGGMRSGIRVDRVVDVLDVVQSAIQPTPTTLPEHMRRIVSGVMRYQDVPVAILDLNQIFADYLRGLG
jgi:purine-binding chemotaxis protein CheW